MNSMAAALSDYLTLRNGLGHQLADAARLLPRFVEWMDTTGQSTITVAAAMEWCQQPQADPGSVVWSRRMTAVRGFARYLTGIDPATEVPPRGLLPERHRWSPPFLYSPNDIDTLLDGARTLPSPLRAATYETPSNEVSNVESAQSDYSPSAARLRTRHPYAVFKISDSPE